jgi:hypothetical protein
MEIHLTQGRVAIVDKEDFEWAAQFKWHWVSTGCRSGYAVRSVKRKGIKYSQYLHREITKRIAEIPDGKVVDHINRNSLDNRRENLRVVTKKENNRNRGGVGEPYFHYRSKNKNRPWEMKIWINGKSKYLGAFESKEAGLCAWQTSTKPCGLF